MTHSRKVNGKIGVFQEIKDKVTRFDQLEEENAELKEQNSCASSEIEGMESDIEDTKRFIYDSMKSHQKINLCMGLVELFGHYKDEVDETEKELSELRETMELF